MKLAVMSDFHLGYAYNTERREDSFIQADEALQLAQEQKVDAILIAGDIFDSRLPSPDILGRAISLFKKFNEIPIIAIHGTHERRGKDLINSVQLLEKAGLLKHLHCNNIVLDINGQKLAVYGMSGVPEDYARVVLEKYHPQPIEGAINVFMLHQSLEPFLYTGQSKSTLNLTDLPHGFDLIVGGHMHWNEEKEYGGGKFIIPGSTILTQMRKIESEKPKGVYIYETKSLTFIPLKTSRKFYYKKLFFENAKTSEVFDKVRIALQNFETVSKKPIVRLILTGTLEKGFSSSDISFSELEKQVSSKIILNIDKLRLGNQEILERREIIERLREKQLSVDELGLELLKQHLEELKYEKLNLTESFLSELAKGDVEEAQKLILNY